MLGHPWIAALVYARELLQARIPEWRKFPWLLALMGPGVARARYGRNAQLIQRKDTQRAIDINHAAPLAPWSGEDRNDRPGPLAADGLDVMAALHRSFLHAWCSPMTKRCSGPDRSARLLIFLSWSPIGVIPAARRLPGIYALPQCPTSSSAQGARPRVTCALPSKL